MAKNTNWTAEQINNAKKRKPIAKPKPIKKKPRGYKQKDHIAKALLDLHLPIEVEYRFAAKHVGTGPGIRQRLKDVDLRDWRFDYCILKYKIAVEYEGIFAGKSRHTTVNGYSGDCDKYNAAQKLGWIVLRYTASNYLSVNKDLDDLMKIFKNKV